jgi:hypothetical protein
MTAAAKLSDAPWEPVLRDFLLADDARRAGPAPRPLSFGQRRRAPPALA